MKVFVTGASGWVGSATVPQLLEAGHEVIALARSDESAAALDARGARVLRGSLADHDVLRAGAEQADGIVHLAFIHDFLNFDASIKADRAAIELFGDVLAGSDRPLAIASGVLGLPSDRVATEQDAFDPAAGGRAENGQTALDLAARGVRASAVRLAPSVHGEGDHGFVSTIIQIARDKGVSGYIGDGANHWPGVHVSDAGALFRLAVEKAPAGSVLHGTAEEGVPTKAIAEVIGKHLDLPVVSIAPADAEEHFGWMARFFALDARTSSAWTRETLGWNPVGPGLLEDLDAGHYFTAAG